VLKAGTSSFDALTDYAIFGAIIFETLAVATVFVFRWKLPQAERPYRCLGYPVVPALYVGTMALVAVTYVVGAKLPIAAVGLVVMGVGAAVYAVLWRLGRG
jgi:amino acid transporter